MMTAILLLESNCESICCPAVLQLFCSSPKAALRYAAVRTLNKVQLHFPSLFNTACFVVSIIHHCHNLLTFHSWMLT